MSEGRQSAQRPNYGLSTNNGEDVRGRPSRSSSMSETDAVFDDDVIEIRGDAQQYLPDDVNHREVFRVECRGSARACGHEQLTIAVGDNELDGESPRRWDEGRLR